jgi:putative holliday junction resolvase
MPDPAAAPPARIVMAFDFGLRRIGIAVGDTVSRSARPLRTVSSVGGQPDWPAIDREIRTTGPGVLVVGSPYNDDGSPGRIAADADRFALELGRRTGLPVERADERYSSVAAAEELRSRRASGERRRLQKGDLDSAAAAVILSSWLGGSP